jgi:ClpP class serine protease
MIDSPGGQIDGLFEAMDAVRSTTTPVRSVVVNRATSAAYGLAAQANSIVALNRASSVGSIGVVTQGRVDSSIITITSSNAPFKRPDISTESGRAVVRKELDDLENLFIQAIANGRDLTQHMVIADYGKGATYLAAEAMRRGMIDAIGVNSPTDNVVTNTPKPVVNNRQNGPFNQQQKANNAMNITELKAEHPALYEQVFALGFKDGNSEGQADERKRVNAHLKLGGRFNAMTTALKAIAEGTSTNDAEVNADYMCAMADARDLAASQADADANNAGKLGDDPATEETTEAKDKRASENILKFAAEKLGIELPVEA